VVLLAVSGVSAIPGSGFRRRFVKLLAADRQLLTDFERTEATDLLKIKDRTRDRTQYEPIFYQSVASSWQLAVGSFPVVQFRETADCEPPIPN